MCCCNILCNRQKLNLKFQKGEHFKRERDEISFYRFPGKSFVKRVFSGLPSEEEKITPHKHTHIQQKTQRNVMQ